MNRLDKPWEKLEIAYERIYKKKPSKGAKSQIFSSWMRHVLGLPPIAGALNQNFQSQKGDQ